MSTTTNDLVLVSGASGFLGTAVCLAYLEKGFRVRGTVRSQEKGDAWVQKHPQFKGQIEFVIVKDVAGANAFDEAVKGVTIVAHTASPFHYDVKDNEKDMLQPAIEGTRQMLQACKKESSVKRVVVTSSFAAVLDMAKLPAVGTTYSDDVWNPATYDEAKKSDNPAFVYCASKTLAEHAAWDFVKNEKPSFSLTTVQPPLILGPPSQVIESMDSLNTSAGAVWSVVDAKELPATSFPVFTDVRDIATIHVLATTEDIAKGQRYLSIAGHFDNSQIVEIIARHFPEQKHRLPKVDKVEVPEHFATDSSKVEKQLGIKWIPFEQSIVDTAKSLFSLEAQLKEDQK